MTPDKIEALTADQLHALQNLAERQPGQDSNFVNIAAALALTRLGLARRGGSGWEITPLGRNHLLHVVPPSDTSADISADISADADSHPR